MYFIVSQIIFVVDIGFYQKGRINRVPKARVNCETALREGSEGSIPSRHVGFLKRSHENV